MTASQAVFRLPQQIDLTTVQSVLAAALAALAAGQTVFDFSAVRQMDSTALALVLACDRAAFAQGIPFHCQGVPDNLLSLARLYGVEAFVSVEGV